MSVSQTVTQPKAALTFHMFLDVPEPATKRAPLPTFVKTIIFLVLGCLQPANQLPSSNFTASVSFANQLIQTNVSTSVAFTGLTIRIRKKVPQSRRQLLPPLFTTLLC